MAGTNGAASGGAAPGIAFVGGEVALDFVNTVANRLAPQEARDRLPTTAALAAWVAAAGLPAPQPDEVSPSQFRAMLAFREALYAVFGAMAVGVEPPAGDVLVVNRAVARTRANRRLVHRANAFAWEWAPSACASDRVLGEIAESAVRVMTGQGGGKLRLCEDAKCGSLFLDRSQGRRRRWCSMAECGNRAKARRHYARAVWDRQ